MAGSRRYQGFGMSKERSGRVYLIGSGPGDPGLITRRGWELVNSCDVVVYDDLIPWEIIGALPENIERIYVGKRRGKTSAVQIEINQLLGKLASEGKTVVRLKGGDPLVFGRCGEELDYLYNAGIPVEIVPGVTAAVAAAAEMGFPLTDRRSASWLVFATGHSAESDSPPVPWNELAGLSGGTIAVYMGLNALPEIVENLRSGGLNPSTPTMVVSHVGGADQQSVEAPLMEIAAKVKDNRVKSPAIVFFGKALDHHHPKSPAIISRLTGKRVLVTRSADQIRPICNLLRKHGAEPIPIPTIAFEPFDDRPGWNKFHQLTDKGGWFIFQSEEGVKHFIRQLLDNGFDLRALGNFKIATQRAGAAQALEHFGIKADYFPAKFSRRLLIEELATLPGFSGSTAIVVGGDNPDETFLKSLASIGSHADWLITYKTIIKDWASHQKTRIIEEPPDFITFTSRLTVQGFVQTLGLDAALKVTEFARVAAIGPSTAEMVTRLDLPLDLVAAEYTVEGLIETMATVEPERRKAGS